MSPKVRAAGFPTSSSSSSFSDRESPPKRPRVNALAGQEVMKINIVQAKLSKAQVLEILSLIDQTRKWNEGPARLQVCDDPRDADVIITAISMPQRLQRHVDLSTMVHTIIVKPEWIKQSVKEGRMLPVEPFFAIQHLSQRVLHPDTESDGYESSPVSQQSMNIASSPTRPAADLSYDARYACMRASPLVCPNQGLVEELSILRRSRELEGEARSAVSYQRAISVLKAYPHQITRKNTKEIKALPYLGPKLLSMVDEYLQNGSIAESRSIVSSTRFQTLSSFAAIYGIGPNTARDLVARGLQSFEDLERYYQAKAEHRDALEMEASKGSASLSVDGKKINLTFTTSLALRLDFEKKIPRGEVEEINRLVMDELSSVQKGCESTIVGGYRRGKAESNDVDIVISHPDLGDGSNNVQDLCKRLVSRLHSRGIVTHVMHLSGFHAPNTLRTANWDSLEKALTVFMLPPESPYERVHRRVDLIFAAPEVYWTAVVGWTGSTMFERDLRLFAKEKKGLKFDSSGIWRRRDSKFFHPKSEKEVFDILGLTWVDPALRNADA